MGTFQSCTLCPRNCRVDRSRQKGCLLYTSKKYYDDLYEAEAVQREEKLLKEAESVKSQSVFSAVEKFKKNYVEKPVQERKMPQTKGPKLSTEEQKVLMREERKRKSKDAGKD